MSGRVVLDIYDDSRTADAKEVARMLRQVADEIASGSEAFRDVNKGRYSGFLYGGIGAPDRIARYEWRERRIRW